MGNLKDQIALLKQNSEKLETEYAKAQSLQGKAGPEFATSVKSYSDLGNAQYLLAKEIRDDPKLSSSIVPVVKESLEKAKDHQAKAQEMQKQVKNPSSDYTSAVKPKNPQYTVGPAGKNSEDELNKIHSHSHSKKTQSTASVTDWVCLIVLVIIVLAILYFVFTKKGCNLPAPISPEEFRQKQIARQQMSVAQGKLPVMTPMQLLKNSNMNAQSNHYQSSSGDSYPETSPGEFLESVEKKDYPDLGYNQTIEGGLSVR
jgi:hypothetical protein